MCDDDGFDACDEGADDPDLPQPPLPEFEAHDFEAIDPEDDDEAEPAPGDFWFESDDRGDE